MNFEIRPVQEADRADFVRTKALTAGRLPSPKHVEATWNRIEQANALAAFDGRELIGTAHWYPFELTVPGPNTVHVGATAGLTVLPTRRRRGVMRALLTSQLTTFRERGFPVAILTASEATAYRRFGFGTSVLRSQLFVDEAHVGLTNEFAGVLVPGRFQLIDDVVEVNKQLPSLHERYRAQKVGEVGRSSVWWHQLIGDNGSDGFGPLIHVAHYDDHEMLDGWACYRTRNRSRTYVGDYEVEIENVFALNDPASRELWRYLLNLDLARTFRADRIAVDDPVHSMFVDARKAQTQVRDFVWVRVLDVVSALCARGFANAGRLIIAVEDLLFADVSATYELTVSDDGTVNCKRTRNAPDLSLDVAELGSVYMGGVGFRQLVSAGRVREDIPGAAERGDAMFRTVGAPFCSLHF